VSDTGSRYSGAGDSTGGEAVGEARRLDGEGSEKDGGEATSDRGERWNTSSSSCPRSSSTSFRLLLVRFAGVEITSGDGGGEAGCCRLDGVGDTASGVGVQGFSQLG
jgi:hypothetical protein